MGISFSSLDSKGRNNDHSSKSDERIGRKDGNHHADTIGPSCFSEVTQFSVMDVIRFLYNGVS